ncbi:hypothetical protein MNV49_007640 [Pseudohyphozyma bogoriensis]|nr:hypothetical protein MNV49_007640 [Pseudohyphozyma bogoriensis]
MAPSTAKATVTATATASAETTTLASSQASMSSSRSAALRAAPPPTTMPAASSTQSRPPLVPTSSSSSSLKTKFKGVPATRPPLGAQSSASSLNLIAPVPSNTLLRYDPNTGRITGDIGKYEGEPERDVVEGIAGGGSSEDLDEALDLPKTTEWSLDKIERGKLLGDGGYGDVYLARTRTEPNFIFALKVQKKKRMKSAESMRNLRREIEIQQALRHPNIVRLYGWFHNETDVFLMLEFGAKGELWTKLQKHKRFSDRRSSNYIQQVTEALIYLHGKHVLHRDIKPENLLLGLDGKVKIADFGLSVHSLSNRRTTFCGTVDYLAPEMVLRDEQEQRLKNRRLPPRENLLEHSTAVDIFAVGVLAYEFLVGYACWRGPSEEAKKAQIKKVQWMRDADIGEEARDAIDKLLQREPEKRLPLEELLKHPWIVRGSDTVPGTST